MQDVRGRNEEAEPVLGTMLGFPRSGTTWAGNLLNAHPSVSYRHEAIGRTLPAVANPEAFESLKSGRDFSDVHYRHIMRHLFRAYPETDRPPFFPKKHWISIAPKLRWFLWLTARKSSGAERVYERAFSRTSEVSEVLLLKETRSTQNLSTILEGLRTDRIIWIIRNPMAVVASHLKGFESGTMAAPGKADREGWYSYHADRHSVRANRISCEDVAGMEAAQFIALQWRVWNEDMLEISRRLQVMPVTYERLHKHTDVVVAEMLNFLGLRFDPQVARFIQSSTSAKRPPLIGRDAGSTYYSVFRGTEFDPNRQASRLPNATQAMIGEVLAESPLLHLADNSGMDARPPYSVWNRQSPSAGREYWAGAY